MNTTEEKKNEILSAYQFRHACKNFKTDLQIADHDFQFILETARLSPSSFGFEPWKFVVVQEKELRDKLKPIAAGAQRQIPTSSHLVFILAKRASELTFDSAYITHMMSNIQQMPDGVATFVSNMYKLFTEVELENNAQLMHEWACKQSYIAMANMMTAAAQIGIDSCPIEGIDREKVASLFHDEGIIDKHEFGVACLVAFGYREEEPKRPKMRQPLEEIVVWA
ncbi:nitroreductase [Paenibacillus sp. SORGH_AS306]|uniref:NAD(P)H-dependent oxidoreductase n=1 Tax=unclassified Paenibacillus TaxID=185978 RepID=UPI002788EBFA|nr:MULTISPECIES: NAD(P)H-dependent oxidoreductase [unclassified Paenibacillus]MDQ1234134.1 nitroreductase [Paenibacillus sp. SORGH_AS_0306]MDR6111178.1 nitroreductase [Paenibacillus sp. SORGH_AS_0338]